MSYSIMSHEVLNSSVNEGPLSVTTMRGVPWVAKIIPSFSMVLAAVMECIR